MLSDNKVMFVPWTREISATVLIETARILAITVKTNLHDEVSITCKSMLFALLFLNGFLLVHMIGCII